MWMSVRWHLVREPHQVGVECDRVQDMHPTLSAMGTMTLQLSLVMAHSMGTI
jgi:hypothetical protein